MIPIIGKMLNIGLDNQPGGELMMFFRTNTRQTGLKQSVA